MEQEQIINLQNLTIVSTGGKVPNAGVVQLSATVRFKDQKGEQFAR